MTGICQRIQEPTWWSPCWPNLGNFELKKKKDQKGYNPLHQVRLHESMFKEINKKRKFYLIVEGQAIKVEKMRMQKITIGNNSIHLVIAASVENHQWMLK